MQYRISYRRGGSFWLEPIGLLIITNVIVYIACSINKEIAVLFSLSPFYFLHEPWTILTSMFIHEPFPGIWHILFNMIALYLFGSFCTNLIGNKKFLLVYFIGGLLGNAAVLWLANPFSYSYGASGAIFAVAGICVAMRPRITVFIMPIPIPMPLWVAMLVFIGLSFLPGTAWQAHLGGLVSGLIMGFFFRRTQRPAMFRL